MMIIPAIIFICTVSIYIAGVYNKFVYYTLLMNMYISIYLKYAKGASDTVIISFYSNRFWEKFQRRIRNVAMIEAKLTLLFL